MKTIKIILGPDVTFQVDVTDLQLEKLLSGIKKRWNDPKKNLAPLELNSVNGTGANVLINIDKILMVVSEDSDKNEKN